MPRPPWRPRPSPRTRTRTTGSTPRSPARWPARGPPPINRRRASSGPDRPSCCRATPRRNGAGSGSGCSASRRSCYSWSHSSRWTWSAISTSSARAAGLPASSVRSPRCSAAEPLGMRRPVRPGDGAPFVPASPRSPRSRKEAGGMVDPGRPARTLRGRVLTIVVAAAVPGCSVVPGSRLDESQRLVQSLRAENARLKDQVLGLEAQNRDYADRAVDDLRRLTARDQAIERLERSVRRLPGRSRSPGRRLSPARRRPGTSGGGRRDAANGRAAHRRREPPVGRARGRRRPARIGTSFASGPWGWRPRVGVRTGRRVGPLTYSRTVPHNPLVIALPLQSPSSAFPFGREM